MARQVTRFKFDKPESFTFPSSRGEVVIRRNQFQIGMWDLLIDRKIVRSAAYSDPREAAEQVGRNDLGDESLNLRYAGLFVPTDLDKWKHSLGSEFLPTNRGN